MTGGPPHATARFLARLGQEREPFLRDHFAAAWGWYERLTTWCTVGWIHRWREACVAAAALGPGDRVLDVATGTGPLLRRAAQRVGPGGLAVGLDLSLDGLCLSRAAAAASSLPARWLQSRALALPFRDGSFDAVLIGFALRHLGALPEVLAELRRVLAPAGRIGIVDFLRPWPGLASRAGLAYLFWVVPALSVLVSRRRAVYRLARYLPHSILDAPDPGQLREHLAAAGFDVGTARPLAAGIVWMFVAWRNR